MKLFTEVPCEKAILFPLSEPVCVLGSCFADAMGARLTDAGFDVLRNPFGTLYNPASIADAVRRLDSGEAFSSEDCIPLGAGDGRIGSFSHHTSFARPSAEEFLAYANARLSEDAARWKRCTRVILTLGTAWVWRSLERPGQSVVANCLKRPAAEFSHELLNVDACTGLLRDIILGHPDKQFLLTVSPIRHLGDGAHANTISKSTLHLAVQQLLDGDAAAAVTPCTPSRGMAGYSLSRTGIRQAPPAIRLQHPEPAEGSRLSGPPSSFGGESTVPVVSYFPAYEILTDELRDYRFYAEDLVHPAPAAVQIIWERFLDACTDPADRPRILEAERTARAAAHRPNR